MNASISVESIHMWWDTGKGPIRRTPQRHKRKLLALGVPTELQTSLFCIRGGEKGQAWRMWLHFFQFPRAVSFRVLMQQEELNSDFWEEDGEVQVIEWGSEDGVDSFFRTIFKAESSPCPPPTSCHLSNLFQSRGLDAVSFRGP